MRVAAFNLAMSLTRGFEGWHLAAYHGQDDPPDVWTIAGGLTTIYGRPVHAGDVLSEAEAERIQGLAIAARMQSVEKLVKVPLDDHQLAALTSFEFNEGDGAFAASTMLKDINAGNLQAAAAEFERWKYAHPNPKVAIVVPGLVRRREAEKEEFLR